MDAEAFKEFEARGWSERARSYEQLTGQVTARLVEPLLDAAGVSAGCRVLDAATGAGSLAAAALGREADVVAVDVAQGMLELARERNPGLETVRADAEELPFADASFDAVVAGCLLNHLPRPERALAGFARVLRPGGRLAATVWDRPERMRLMGLVAEAAERCEGLARGGVPEGGPHPYRFADEGAFAALLEDAGLSRVEVRTIAFSQRVSGIDALWEGMLGGSVRTSALIEHQDARILEQVRAELERMVEPYRRDGGALEIPVCAKLAKGVN